MKYLGWRKELWTEKIKYFQLQNRHKLLRDQLILLALQETSAFYILSLKQGDEETKQPETWRGSALRCWYRSQQWSLCLPWQGQRGKGSRAGSQEKLQSKQLLPSCWLQLGQARGGSALQLPPAPSLGDEQYSDAWHLLWGGGWGKGELEIAFVDCRRRQQDISSCRARHSWRGKGGNPEGGQKDTGKWREYNKGQRKGQKQERVEMKNPADSGREGKCLLWKGRKTKEWTEGKIVRKKALCGRCCQKGQKVYWICQKSESRTVVSYAS